MLKVIETLVHRLKISLLDYQLKQDGIDLVKMIRNPELLNDKKNEAGLDKYQHHPLISEKLREGIVKNDYVPFLQILLKKEKWDLAEKLLPQIKKVNELYHIREEHLIENIINEAFRHDNPKVLDWLVKIEGVGVLSENIQGAANILKGALSKKSIACTKWLLEEPQSNHSVIKGADLFGILMQKNSDLAMKGLVKVSKHSYEEQVDLFKQMLQTTYFYEMDPSIREQYVNNEKPTKELTEFLMQISPLPIGTYEAMIEAIGWPIEQKKEARERLELEEALRRWLLVVHRQRKMQEVIEQMEKPSHQGNDGVLMASEKQFRL